MIPGWMNQIGRATLAIKTIYTQSALNPMLWLSGLCIFAFIPIALWTDSDFRFLFALLLLSPVLVAMLAYVYFMIVDPDRLHSEKHRQEMRRMELLGDNLIGRPAPTLSLPSSNPIAESGDE